jgi:uncharacterized LabA/DUF88 family protein
MKAIDFIVDGFNLYHSAKQAAWRLRIPTKWLNIDALCRSFIHITSRVLSEKTELRSIYYFSALADHLEDSHPGITKRHKAFLKCLEDTGVIVELSRFKPKEIRCPHPECGRTFVKHEEKETDVAIALKLVEVFMTGECDAAVLMTGDTDLAPAVRTTHRLFPDKRILFAFPPYRKNHELSKLAPGSFSFKTGQFVKHQFSDPYTTKSGLIINKPPKW